MIAHDETLCDLLVRLQARGERLEDLELGDPGEPRSQEASDTQGHLADSDYANAIRSFNTSPSGRVTYLTPAIRAPA